MRTWHFYDLATGDFLGRTFTAFGENADEHLGPNTPARAGAHEGADINHLRQRKCLVTGAVLDRDAPPVSGYENLPHVKLRKARSLRSELEKKVNTLLRKYIVTNDEALKAEIIQLDSQIDLLPQ